MTDPQPVVKITSTELRGATAPDSARELRVPTEEDLIVRVSLGEQVELTVPSLTADTGIQGIAIGKIYQSWAIHEKPPTRTLNSAEEIRHEAIRVEDACRTYLGTPDVQEALMAVQRARGVLRRASDWNNFVGEFLFEVYIAPDIFKDTRFFEHVESYRGMSSPEPENLKEQVDAYLLSLPTVIPNDEAELVVSAEQFRIEKIAEYQLSLLNQLKMKIIPELDQLIARLQKESRGLPDATHHSLTALPINQVFIGYAREVARRVRMGENAESAAYSSTEKVVEGLRRENSKILAELETEQKQARETSGDWPFERDLAKEYSARSTIKDNMNKIAEYVGQRTTLLRCLRNEFLDLRNSASPSSDMVVIVGDLVVPCSLHAIPPSQRAGMICSEENGIGHTELAFTSTMKPIAGASELVLNVLKSCTDSTTVIYDGARRLLIINPSEKVIAEYRAERDRLMVQIEKPLPLILDAGRQRPVEVLINVRSAQAELVQVLRSMGAGVGLYTPESDFEFEALMEKTSAERQVSIFEKLLELSQSITIRAFDFSGDKFKYRKEPNIRGSTFARDHSWTTREELIEQFAALLQAGSRRTQPFILLFPNITGTANLGSYLEALDRAFEQAKSAPLTGILQAGIQIESIIGVQNTLNILRSGARNGRDPQIRLVAIGTNDLGMEVTQHEVGHEGDDRTTARVNHYNPELYQHIYSVRQQIDIYNRQQRGRVPGFKDIPLEVCGVMAGQRVMVPVLIGLGVNKFSVAIGSAHDIAQLITRFEEKACIQLALSLMRMKDSEQVKDALIEFWDQQLGLLDFDVRRDGEIVPIFNDEFRTAAH